MILVIKEVQGTIAIKKNVAYILKVSDFAAPDGITETIFTEKGQLIGASAADTPQIVSKAASDGLVLLSNSSKPAGLEWGEYGVTIEDTTNHLYNGGFDFAQRQVPGTDTTISDEKYGPDRWRMTRENAELQYSRQDGSADSALKSKYYGKFTKITNAGKFLIYQPLEHIETIPLRDGNLIFQLKMKASSAKTIKIAILELAAAGTADTLPANLVSAWNIDSTDPTLATNIAVVASGSKSVTTSWTTFNVTGSAPTDSKNLIVAIWSDADFSATDILYLAEAGLYRGTSTQNWSPRPIGEELARCQRYYCKSYDPDIAPGTTAAGYSHFYAVTTSNAYGNVKYPVTMRGIATVTCYDITGTANKMTRATTTTAVNINTTYSNYNVFYRAAGSSVFTVGELYWANYTADVEL